MMLLGTNNLSTVAGGDEMGYALYELGFMEGGCELYTEPPIPEVIEFTGPVCELPYEIPETDIPYYEIPYPIEWIGMS